MVEGITTGITRLKDLLASVNIPPEVGNAIDHATQGIQAWFSTQASAIAGSIATVATVGLLATFLTFFFLMDGDKAWDWAMASANQWRRATISTAGHVALERVGGYLRGTAVIAAFDGFVEGLFLVILGVPNAGALGVIVFLGRFIPYIGGLVTTIILLFATLASQGQSAAIVLLVLITILNVIQGKFLAPVIYHRTVHIHPAIALIALPAGAALAGIIGLFAAIPVVAFVLAIIGALVSILGVEDPAPVSSNPMVPIWLDRLGQWSWRLLATIGLLAVFIAVVIAVPIVVIPLVLGIVLAATLAPFGSYLERRGWSHGRAALGATLGAAVGITILIALTLISLSGPLNDMINTAIAGSNSADTSTGGQAGILVTLVQTFGAGVLVTIAGILSSLGGGGRHPAAGHAPDLLFHARRRRVLARRSSGGSSRDAGRMSRPPAAGRSTCSVATWSGRGPSRSSARSPSSRSCSSSASRTPCRWPSWRSSAGSSRISGRSSRPAWRSS